MNCAFAQNEDEFVKTTQQDLIIVAGAGVGGAILGLSTLSFYDKPSKHVPNIWTGAAIGVIVGVIFVAYNGATRNQGDLTSQVDGKSFETTARRNWHDEKFSLNLTSQSNNSVSVWHQDF